MPTVLYVGWNVGMNYELLHTIDGTLSLVDVVEDSKVAWLGFLPTISNILSDIKRMLRRGGRK